MQDKVLKQKILDYYQEGMPFCDKTDVSLQILEGMAGHAAYLRSNVAWCCDLPDDIFFEHVAPYRINNEKIEDCRAFFFHKVWPVVRDMTMEEASMAANVWCAAQASYHQADSRTANAMTVYKSGFGRCGEESVFVVTVLRSIGIPARQVYAPWWSHCDDNHAWVEVWCGGEWQYLGACEPLPGLNQGWFDVPASRAMLVHARRFGTGRGMDEVISDSGCVQFLNVTSRYAGTVRAVFCLKDSDGHVFACRQISLEVLNYSSYRSIARMVTDSQGRIELAAGRGSVRFACVENGRYLEADVSLAGIGDATVQTEVVMREAQQEVWREHEFTAPLRSAADEPPCRAADGIQVFQMDIPDTDDLGKRRELRRRSYYRNERAAAFPEAEDILREAAGNFDELIEFLEKDNDPHRLGLLRNLTQKDWYDAGCDILEEHLAASRQWAGKWDEDIFLKYIQNPRVEQEELSCFRKRIESFFTPQDRQRFSARPEEIWESVCLRLREPVCDAYHTLRITPLGALASQTADVESRRILFTAICRTFGIPARLNPETGRCQYMADGEFRDVEHTVRDDRNQAVIRLSFEQGGDWKYQSGFTLSRLNESGWEELNLEGRTFSDDWTECVEAGLWRIVCTHRYDNGSQSVREGIWRLERGRTYDFELTKPAVSVINLKKAALLPEVKVRLGEAECSISSVLAGRKGIVIWLEEGKEPTEHILNELLERSGEAAACKGCICLISQKPPKQGKTLFRLLESTGLRLYMALDNEACIRAAKLSGRPVNEYPLCVALDEQGHMIYAVSGYDVGAAGRLLAKII